MLSNPCADGLKRSCYGNNHRLWQLSGKTLKTLAGRSPFHISYVSIEIVGQVKIVYSNISRAGGIQFISGLKHPDQLYHMLSKVNNS